MTVWRAGMLAVIVNRDELRGGEDEQGRSCIHGGKSVPDVGSCHRVKAIVQGSVVVGKKTGAIWRCGCLVLEFEGGASAVAARCRPAVQDDQACEEDFVALLKRSAPTKITQPQSEPVTPHGDSLAGECAPSHAHAFPTHPRCETRDDALCRCTKTNCFIANHEG